MVGGISPTDETVLFNFQLCNSLYGILFKVHRLGVRYEIYGTWCASLVA